MQKLFVILAANCFYSSRMRLFSWFLFSVLIISLYFIRVFIHQRSKKLAGTCYMIFYLSGIRKIVSYSGFWKKNIFKNTGENNNFRRGIPVKPCLSCISKDLSEGIIFFTILNLIFQKKFSNKSIMNCAEIVRFRTVGHFRQYMFVYPQDVNISKFEFQFLKNIFVFCVNNYLTRQIL